MHLLGAVLSGFALAMLAPALYRLAGRAAGWTFALLPISLALYFAGFLPEISLGRTVRSVQAWMPSLDLYASWHLDGLALLFVLLITSIGALVLVYSSAYLEGHPRLARYYTFFLLFMASMLGLVLADNLLFLYVFWELTTITSFFLIGFEAERDEARAAAWQALIVTSAGGLAFLAGIILLAQTAGTYEISRMAGLGEQIRNDARYPAILTLFLLGAFTKSAQFPFHFWLPGAMQAPTPVSAYLHAATMVKAGVYLLARMNPVLGGTDAWLIAITTVGAITMLGGTFLGFFERDVKLVLAYSTVGVLGILTFLTGLGTAMALKTLALYLIGHGLYKGALFLVVGVLDHETGTRDIQFLSGLRAAMPVTAGAGFVAALSMAGLPPLFGFIGKEALYETGLESPVASAVFTLTFVTTGAMLFALAAITGFRPFVGPRLETPRTPHEAPLRLWLGPLLLAFGGVVLGIAPGAVAGLVEATVLAAGPDVAEPVHLSLYHGLNRALFLSLISAVAGVWFYGVHRRMRGPYPHLKALALVGPMRLYGLAVQNLNRIAATQTRILQSGYLRYYLMIIIIATMGFLGSAMALRSEMPKWLPGFGDMQAHELILGVITVLAVFLAVWTESRLTAVAAIGVIGISVSTIFALFGAPDLAITLLVIETLTVILLVLVLYHLPDFSALSTPAGRYRDAAIAIAAGALMTVLVINAGVLSYAPSTAAYFVENSWWLARGRNVVNVILTDFRVLDTLGEITVLSVAGVGVYALLRLRPLEPRR